MARTPLRWDNVALPQFSNSGLSVAAGSFLGAADRAAALAKSLHERELENQANQEQDALTQALARAYSDSKIDESDFARGAAAGVGPNYYKQIQEGISSAAAVDRERALAAEAQAQTAFTKQEMTFQPGREERAANESAAQIAANEAHQRAAEARGRVSEAELSRLNDEAENATRIAEAERSIDQHLYGIAPPQTDTLGNQISSGSLPWQASQEFEQNKPTIIQKALAKNGLNLMQVPPEELKKVEEELRKNYTDTFINNRLRDPMFEARLAADNNMTVREFREHTKAGQDNADIDKMSQEIAGRNADEAEKNRVAMQEVIKSARDSGTRDNFMYDGKRHTVTLTTNNIGASDATALAEKYGITDEKLVTEARLRFPHKVSFENILKDMATDRGESRLPGGNLFRGEGWKQKDNAWDILNKAVTASEGALEKGQISLETFSEGPIEENAVNFAAAEFSRFGHPQPKQDTTAGQGTTGTDKAAQFDSALERFRGMNASELKQLKQQNLEKGSKVELDALTQSLKEAREQLPRIHQFSKSHKITTQITDLLKEAEETDWRDRRSSHYTYNIRKIEDKLQRLYDMGNTP